MASIQAPNGAGFVVRQKDSRSCRFRFYFFVVGLLGFVRSLPFGLALGIGRRSYYAGTAGQIPLTRYST